MSVAHSTYNVKRVSRKRNTHDQIRASMAMFAPSPSFQPDVTQIKIIQDRGSLLAFLDVDLYLGPARIFLMRGVRIVRQNDGSIFCQFPHQAGRDGRYYPIICAHDQTFKAAIESAALTAYYNAVSDKVVQLAMDLGQEASA